MDWIPILLTVLGLSLFEVVMSVDNAIINAEVLGTMTPRGRRWFLVWGILIAVFLVRGFLPWLIFWASNPGLGPIEAFLASFSDDPHVAETIEQSAPILRDATFSIDGILGAFAFTFSIPIILVGNGLGALVVRQLTVGNIERVKRYKYLKNGAMYSIFALGLVMVLHSFGTHVPEWVSPLLTFAIIGWFFYQSYRELGASEGRQPSSQPSP